MAKKKTKRKKRRKKKRKAPERLGGRAKPPDGNVDPNQGVTKPQDWEKVVSVAYLRCTGHTQEEAAKGAGCSVRAIQEWEKSSFWLRAWEEAKSRWLQGIEVFTRRSILAALNSSEEYAVMSRWVGERLIPELAPPKLRSELIGNLGIGRVDVVITHADNKRDDRSSDD